MPKKLPNKKVLIIAGALTVLIAAGVIIWSRTRTQPAPPPQEEERQQNRITEAVNVIPVSDSPYMLLLPRANGRYIDIVLQSIVLPADEMEYELEYQSGSLIQASFDNMTINQVPTQKEVFLGSCSAGGACTYHEDIKGGTLLMRFNGEEQYVLKSDWRYIDNADRENAIASRDAKFQLESDNLAANRYLIIFNSPGAPEGLEAELKSDIYAVASSSNLAGEGSLTIRAAEEGEALTIYGYDGSEWTEFESEVDGKQVTAEVELMQTYVVAEPQS